MLTERLQGTTDMYDQIPFYTHLRFTRGPTYTQVNNGSFLLRMTGTDDREILFTAGHDMSCEIVLSFCDNRAQSASFAG